MENIKNGYSEKDWYYALDFVHIYKILFLNEGILLGGRIETKHSFYLSKVIPRATKIGGKRK